MGNPYFAISPLKKIIESQHDLVAVISNPPKPMGRKKVLKYTDVGKFALDNNIKLIELDSFDDQKIYQEVVSLNVDLFIVVAYRILPTKYLEIPKFGAINIHASLLPKYRGAAPIQWALMNGDEFTGVSIFQIEKKVDTGKIIFQDAIKIENDDNFETLSNKLSKLGGEALIKSLDMFVKGKINLIIQDNSQFTRAPKINKDMLKINWSWPGEKINNWVRGLCPYPAMYTIYKEKKIKIFKVKLLKETSNSSHPGKIDIIDSKKLIVHSKNYMVSILELQQEGKKRLKVEDFLKGSIIDKGQKFSYDANS